MMLSSGSALLFLLTSALVSAAADQCSSTTSYSNVLVNTQLTVECRVPQQLVYNDSNSVWHIDNPFFLPDCSQRDSMVLICSAMIESAAGDGIMPAATYSRLGEHNCTYKCVYAINIPPPVTSTAVMAASTSSSYRLEEASSSALVPSAIPTISPGQELTVVIAAVAAIGVLVTVFLIVGGSAIGLMMWRRKSLQHHHQQQTAAESDKQHLMMQQDEVDSSGFMIGVKQNNLFTATSSNKRDSVIIVPFTSIIMHELIHKGTFKLVHRAKLNSTDIAVKQLKDPSSEKGKAELLHEIAIMKKLAKIGNHLNIVSLVGITEGEPLCLLLEYVSHGTLQQFLKHLCTGPLPQWYTNHLKTLLVSHYHQQVAEDMMRVLLQVADAGKYLVDNNITHGDIATRNVLLGNNLLVKLTNFGIQREAKYFNDTGRAEFLQTMAPEVIQAQEYTSWSDVWSFGVLVYLTATLESREPYKECHTAEELHKAMESGARPKAPSCYSNELHFLLQQCWQFEPNDRISFSKLCEVLTVLAQSPAHHITLSVSTKRRGYVDGGSGRVFLNPPPPSIYNKPNKHLSTVQVTPSATDDSGVDSFPHRAKPSSSSELTATQITQDEDGQIKIVKSISNEYHSLLLDSK